MNPVEKTIVVVVAYCIAILAIVLLHVSGVLQWPVVVGGLAAPLILGACASRLQRSLVLAAFTAALGTPFILSQGALVIAPMFAGYLLAAGAIGMLNQKRAARKERWRRARSIEDRHDREVFDCSMNVLHFVDRDGTIMKRNEASRTVLGHPTKRTLTLSEYVHPQDLDQMKTELLRLFERKEIRDVKLRLITEERKSVPVELRATRVTERLALVEARDLREKADLERKLMETEARYRFLIEEAVDTLDSGIIITDSRRHVVWANETIGEFFGIDRDRLIGIDSMRAFARFVGVFDNPDEFGRKVEEAVDSRAAVDSLTCTVTPRIGRPERVLAYRSIPIETDRYKGGRIDHFIDITEIKKLEKGLREKTRHLESTNEKLEQFCHVVSHDLKEPLRTIQVYSGILLEDYATAIDEEGTNYLTKMRTTSARMRELIDDLLQLASIRMDSASFERVSVDHLMEEIKQDLDARLRGVNLRIDGGLPAVKGSRVRLGELFSNLIVNAIKYNDKALPTVHVGLVTNASRNGMCTFFVKDNGIGIEARFRDKVFGIFQKLEVKKGTDGTGAGLAICKRIVEEHGGRIWVESEVGQGSSFFFTIPKAAS